MQREQGFRKKISVLEKSIPAWILRTTELFAWMYLAPYTTMCVVPAGASSEEVKITFTLEQAMKA